jgi:hypothetical protein
MNCLTVKLYARILSEKIRIGCHKNPPKLQHNFNFPNKRQKIYIMVHVIYINVTSFLSIA